MSSSIPNTPEIPKTPPSTHPPVEPKLEPKSVTKEGRSLKHVPSEELSHIPTPPPLPAASTAPRIHKRVTSTPHSAAKQQKAINKLKQKIKDAPKTATSHAREIQLGSEKLHLKRIAKQIQKSKASSTPAYELPKMGRSGNPVGRIGGAVFVPKNILEKNLTIGVSSASAPALTLKGLENYYAKEEVLNELRLILANETEDPALSEIIELMTEIKAMPDSCLSESILAPVVGDLLDQLTPLISSSDFITANANSATAAAVIQNTAKLSRMTTPQFVFKTGPENVREQLAGKLLTSLGLAQPLAPKTDLSLPGAKLLEKDLRDGTRLYQENPEGIASSLIEGTTLKSIQAWQDFKKESHQLAQNQFSIQHHTKTVQTLEAKLQQLSASIRQWDQSIADTAEQSAALKLELIGHTSRLKEITQEIDAIHEEMGAFPSGARLQELNDQLQINNRLRAQIVEKMEQLQGTLAEVLTSNEIANDHRATFQNQMLSQTNLLNTSKAELARLNQPSPALEQARNALLALGGEKDIQTHVLTDLLFCSSDSHDSQYIVSEGHITNIDFARFLTPGNFWKTGGGHKAILYSTLLNHPYAKTPLNADLENQIMAWDVNEIEAQWQGDDLIGDPNQYVQAGEALQYFKTEIARYEQCPPEQLPKLLKEFEASSGIKQTKNDEATKADILKGLRDNYAVLQKRCFSQVHPAAFEDFKQRVTVLQKHIRDCHTAHKSATLDATFPLLYPELKPFMAPAARLYANSTNGISTAGSLEDFIKTIQQQQQATPEEVREMQQALAVIKDKAIDGQDLFTTISI